MNDYDARQCRMIRNQIRLYEEGGLELHALVSNLEALMACLTAPDDVWLADFRQQWSILEQVYAVAADRQQDLQRPNFATSAALALERMN
jgi:hypothetical protein